MNNDMNFFDLCAACGRAIGRGCAACWRMIERMLRLTYRYWWLVLTLVGVWALVKPIPEFELFGRIDFFGTTWSKWVAKMIMTCIVLVWNYIGRKIFIFKS